MNIHWYPGHMAKTRREITESLREVDLVAELVDARIPRSSRNPVLEELAGERPRIVVLNRADQADAEGNRIWTQYFQDAGATVVQTNSKSGEGAKMLAVKARALLTDKLEEYRKKGQIGRAIKIMVVGVPNVGKSSLINRLSGKKPAKTEDRPGVTRKRQWIHLEEGIDLLDTPGILWPKLDDERTGLCLAFTGAIRDDILDLEWIAYKLLETLSERAPDALRERYRINAEPGIPGSDLFNELAKKRGFLISGGEIDGERTARVLLDEFRGGRLGRVTLELPEARGDVRT